MVNEWKKVFVTVGTTKFDQLIHQITNESTLRFLSMKGCVELTLQLGSTHWTQQLDSNVFNINIKTYDYKNTISEDIKNADLVIGHAGAGTTLEVLRQHKPLLVVINEELMSNHQKELAQQLRNDNYLLYCNTNTLIDGLSELSATQLKPFPEANPSLFANFIDNIYLSKITNNSHID